MWKNACNILAFYEKNISSQDTKEKQWILNIPKNNTF